MERGEGLSQRGHRRTVARVGASLHELHVVVAEPPEELLGPLLPFTTEEVWHWWQDGSVHLASWPTPPTAQGVVAVLHATSSVLVAVRRAKTEAKVSQRAAVERCTVSAPADVLAALVHGASDLRDAGSIAVLATVEAAELSVDVVLAPTP